MESPIKAHHLFEVYLRLRPSPLYVPRSEPILLVEEPRDIFHPSQITLNPPLERRRATERFSFTQVFPEEASQLDVFHGTEVASLVRGVLAPQGGEGTDAVIATLGVTGSGKTHTILGSRSQRGLTQLALNVLFRSIGDSMVQQCSETALESLQDYDASEAVLIAAPHFLDGSEVDLSRLTRSNSWAPSLLSGDFSMLSASGMRPNLPHPSSLPRIPDVSDVHIPCDPSVEHIVVVSMYEVHNDRIYDLLTPTSKWVATKEFRRRPLLYKSTELSPDRKVVAGLCKIVCMDLEEALLVVEAGLQQRRVASTGSNSVSSRSHGFFCFEVKKRMRNGQGPSWTGSKLTVVDLAGSERAKETKTQGATLVEAGKINESLMYLGQCLQAQSEACATGKSNVIPYRQCKLTELLFSNSFPSQSTAAFPNVPHRNPQKGIMIITADPLGDFTSTSQILRYSALAREVATHRVESVASAVYSDHSAASDERSSDHHADRYHEQKQPQEEPPQNSTYFYQSQFRPFAPAASVTVRKRPPPVKGTGERITMELAALEIARLSDEIDQLRDEAEMQTEARITAEAHLLSMEDRMLELEANVREDCAVEFEERLALEIARFKTSMQAEKERNEEHWDRKVDLLQSGLGLDNDDDGGGGDEQHEDDVLEDLRQEVERLQRENGVLRRELMSRSPTKRKSLEERGDGSLAPEGVSSLGRRMEQMRIGAAGDVDAGLLPLSTGNSPKKVRKLGKRWEMMDFDR